MKLYTCFVDLSAAYDHINRDLLFKCINNRLPPGLKNTNFNILKSLYDNTTSYISSHNPDIESFKTTSGVRQGGNESPNLYNYYKNYSMRVWRYKCQTENVKQLNIPFLIPIEATDRTQRMNHPVRGIYTHDDGGYADDVGIHDWTREGLQKKMIQLFEVFTLFGLRINISKTETMIWNWRDDLDGPYPNTIINIKNVYINNVSNFKYLGVWMNNNDIHIYTYRGEGNGM